MKKPIKILCDDREPKSMDVFAMTVGDIELERKRLKVGDYVHQNIAIERKEINDFCGSIMDGRLTRQIENMKATFEHNYVIVVGRIKDRTSDIHENCILGKMASIIVKHQMNLVFVDDEFQFCYIMKRIFEKHMEKSSKK